MSETSSATFVGDLFQADVEPDFHRLLGVPVENLQRKYYSDAGEDGRVVAQKLTEEGLLELMNRSKRKKTKIIDPDKFETDMLVKAGQFEASALEDLVLVHDSANVCDIKEDVFLLAEFGTTSDTNVENTVKTKMCQLERNIAFFSRKHEPVTCAVLVTTQNVKAKCLTFLKKHKAELPRLHALMSKARFFNYFQGNSLSVFVRC